jgi:tetratricopeptide (TPR) repeat protein
MTFVHPLVREVVYRSITKERRSLLHEDAGTRLQRGASEANAIVGRHLEAAYLLAKESMTLDGRGERLVEGASRHLSEAGARAMQEARTPEAVDLIDRAQKVLPAESPDRARLLVELAEALQDLGDDKKALDALAEFARIYSGTEEHPVRLRASLLSTRALLSNGELTVAQAIDRAESAVGMLRETGDDATLALALYLLGYTNIGGFQLETARIHIREALDLARRTGDRRLEGKMLINLALAGYYGPQAVPDAIGEIKQTMQGNDSLRVTGRCLLYLGSLCAMDGDLESGFAYTETGVGLLSELGLSKILAYGRRLTADLHSLAGDAVSAEAELRKGYEVLRGDPMSTGVGVDLAVMLCGTGNLKEAEAIVNEIAPLTVPDDTDVIARVSMARALLASAQGDHGTADLESRSGVERSETTDGLLLQAEALLVRAEVLGAGGDSGAADAHRERARDAFRKKGDLVDAARLEG